MLHIRQLNAGSALCLARLGNRSYGLGVSNTKSELSPRWKSGLSVMRPNWQFLSKQTQALFGAGCAKGRTPEIYGTGAALDRAVERMSNGQIARLVSVLRHGSSGEQRDLIQEVTAVAF